MARLIILQFKGKESKFNFKKINRSNLYGKKKRVFLDELNKECTTAIIDTSFGLLIHSGDASSVYIDEQKNYINRDDISGIDSEGNIVDRIPSTLNTPQKLQIIEYSYQSLNFEFRWSLGSSTGWPKRFSQPAQL